MDESGWYKIGSQMTVTANQWANRGDLVVGFGDGGAHKTAWTRDDIAEIGLSSETAFGNIDPSMVGDFTLPETWNEWPEAAGLLAHEAAHARFSFPAPGEGQLSEAGTLCYFLMEEARCEYRMLQVRPELRRFIRAGILKILVQSAGTNVDPVRLSLLVDARVDAGVLKRSDFKKYQSTVDPKMREIWKKFQRSQQLQERIELAEEMAALLGSGSDSDMESDWEDALSDMARVRVAVDDEIATEQAKQKAEAREQAKRKEKDREERVEAATVRAFGAGFGTSSVERVRKPTGQERASAGQIARKLARVKYRDREVRTVRVGIPNGRMNVGMAMQNHAERVQGGVGTALPWKQKRRTHVEDARLVLGIICDVSGSMGSAMEPMASAAWIMGEVAHRISGTVAAVNFGSRVKSVLRPGQRLEQVTIYHANESTTAFAEAARALDGVLNLTGPDASGARLVVICSDGGFGGNRKAEEEELERWQKAGVAVVWLSVQGMYESGAKKFADRFKAEYVQVPADTGSAANAIGQACVRALQKVSG